MSCNQIVYHNMYMYNNTTGIAQLRWKIRVLFIYFRYEIFKNTSRPRLFSTPVGIFHKRTCFGLILRKIKVITCSVIFLILILVLQTYLFKQSYSLHDNSDDK